MFCQSCRNGPSQHGRHLASLRTAVFQVRSQPVSPRRSWGVGSELSGLDYCSFPSSLAWSTARTPCPQVAQHPRMRSSTFLVRRRLSHKHGVWATLPPVGRRRPLKSAASDAAKTMLAFLWNDSRHQHHAARAGMIGVRRRGEAGDDYGIDLARAATGADPVVGGAPAASACLMQDGFRPGLGLDSTVVSSEGECCQLCDDTVYCVAWNFKSATCTCCLLHTLSGPVLSGEGWVTGTNAGRR